MIVPLPDDFEAIGKARLALHLLAGDPPQVFDVSPGVHDRYMSVMTEIVPALEQHPETLHPDLDRDALAAILTRLRFNCEGPVREGARIDFDAMDAHVRELAALLAPSIQDSPAARKLFYPPDPPLFSTSRG